MNQDGSAVEMDGDAGERSGKMAPCGDCGRMISRRAVMCPGCGRSFRGSPRFEVDVTDVDMSFGAMIYFMVKWVIAAIPAALMLGALAFALMMVVTSMGWR